LIANGETPTHSKLAALGEAVGLFHHVLHRKTSSGSSQSRRMGNLLEVFSRLDEWTTLAASAMPDHLHALVAPLDLDASVGALSKWFKRWFNEEYWTNNWRASLPNADSLDGVSQKRPTTDGTQVIQTWKWQEGCFDRLLRSDESLSEKWEYLRQNPVRAGLVANPEDWPFQFASTGDKL
jgi:REP element-mobilizing transposase RayT